jgi:excinuclease ABC subunit B
VILYADKVTDSMQAAIDETNRRRALQVAYNEQHGITPASIKKAIRKGIEEEVEARRIAQEAAGITSEQQFVTREFIAELEAEMLAAAESLEFERAAGLRDRIVKMKQQLGQPLTAAESEADTRSEQPLGPKRRAGAKRKKNAYSGQDAVPTKGRKKSSS